MNLRLSKNFLAREFRCRCDQCEFTGQQMNPDFVDFLQQVRTIFDREMLILSAIRCPAHNRRVGGKPQSFHTLGRAVDVAVVDPYLRHELMRIVLDMGGTCGVYSTFIHIDNRKNPLVFYGGS